MNNFKAANSILSVTLTKNPFSTEENSFVGRVTRNTVTLENLIASIAEKNSGVSPFMIQHVANILQNEILLTAQNGNAVDVLGLGTMFISVAGSVTGATPNGTSIPGFRISFTPSSKTQSVVDSLKVDKVVIAETGPVIDKIINTFTQNQDFVLNKGKGVRITGTKLKITGTDSGIWFAPVDTEGLLEKDESKWIAVPATTVSTNNPKTLEFYVPDTVIEESEYSIVLRTRYSSGNKELKSIAEAHSGAVTVIV